MASRCSLKIRSRLQQGNKIIVFNIKVSFKIGIEGNQRSQLVKTTRFVFTIS